MTDPSESSLTILALAVGNSRTRLGLFIGSDLHDPRSVSNDDPARIAAAAASFDLPEGHASIVIASVNDPIANAITRALAKGPLAGIEVHRVGRDLPIPINHTLDDPSTVGHDRLLNAIGAYAKTGQACVIIDAGTAVTVDFIDGEGSFHGGAIMPGVQMMLDALHEHAVALPGLRFEPPTVDPFGVDTKSAMLLGVAEAVRGGAHALATRYANYYEAYPQIIATGGDAAALFEHDEIVEHLVPDLQLIGIRAVCERLVEEEIDSAHAPDADPANDAPDRSTLS